MSPRKVFVSYSHRQEDWVVDRLVPVLRAGGTEVLIDREIFGVGRSLLGQMDTSQDQADVHLLVLSPDYLASPMCRHEMDRAVALDPKFETGVVVPVLRVSTPLPSSITTPNPLYADLVDEEIASWDLLLRGVGADLGTNALAWLTARDEVRKFLVRGKSVNLVVARGIDWRPLLKDLRRGELADLGEVDLASLQANSRRGLIEEVLAELGSSVAVPGPPEDLVAFGRALRTRKKKPGRIALVHFDHAASRESYGLDFFSSLRYLAMEARTLTLLVQSREPFAALLPTNHPLSSEMGFETVFLRGRR